MFFTNITRLPNDILERRKLKKISKTVKAYLAIAQHKENSAGRAAWALSTFPDSYKT